MVGTALVALVFSHQSAQTLSFPLHRCVAMIGHTEAVLCALRASADHSVIHQMHSASQWTSFALIFPCFSAAFVIYQQVHRAGSSDGSFASHAFAKTRSSNHHTQCRQAGRHPSHLRCFGMRMSDLKLYFLRWKDSPKSGTGSWPRGRKWTRLLRRLAKSQ